MDSVMQQYGRSLINKDKPFYNCTVIEDNFQYTIFSSGNLLERLATMPAQRSYHVDATFKVVPNGSYKQLMIIHVAYNEHVSVNVIIVYCSDDNFPF